MGIDRTGPKGPPNPPPPDTSGVGRATDKAAPFVSAKAPVADAAVSPQASGVNTPGAALERLRSGEIDLNGYLDLKTHEATAHLSSLPPSELEAIRGALRERLASDPTLVDLVRTVTGPARDPASQS